jgi:hypothetical protein
VDGTTRCSSTGARAGGDSRNAHPRWRSVPRSRSGTGCRGFCQGGQIGAYSLSEPQAGSELVAGQCGKAGGHRRCDGGHQQGEVDVGVRCASKCVVSSASRSVLWRLSPTMMPTAARVVAANAAVTGAGAVSCSGRCAAPPNSPEHGHRYGQRDSRARATALGTLSVGTSACAFWPAATAVRAIAGR